MSDLKIALRVSFVGLEVPLISLAECVRLVLALTVDYIVDRTICGTVLGTGHQIQALAR